MDFNLSREHQLIRKMMAEFTENEVKPIAAETDKTSQYPRENIEKLFNLGVILAIGNQLPLLGNKVFARALLAVNLHQLQTKIAALRLLLDCRLEQCFGLAQLALADQSLSLVQHICSRCSLASN